MFRSTGLVVDSSVFFVASYVVIDNKALIKITQCRLMLAAVPFSLRSFGAFLPFDDLVSRKRLVVERK